MAKKPDAAESAIVDEFRSYAELVARAYADVLVGAVRADLRQSVEELENARKNTAACTQRLRDDIAGATAGFEQAVAANVKHVAGLRAQLSDLGELFRRDVGAAGAEMRENVGAAAARLAGDVDDARARIDVALASLETDADAVVAGLRSRLDAVVAATSEAHATRLDGAAAELRAVSARQLEGLAGLVAASERRLLARLGDVRRLAWIAVAIASLHAVALGTLAWVLRS